MIIDLKHNSTKKSILIAVFFVFAMVADYSFELNNQEENLTEARFLGWGTKVKYTDCFMGHRYKITKYTVFFIRVGEETWESESC